VSPTSLFSQLDLGSRVSGSGLCIGLDPDPGRIPPALGSGPRAIERFCVSIVEATADLACAFKPQIAHFSALGAEPELERVCAAIRDLAPHAVVILDAKRGDIGSTAQRYAAEAFERYGAHAVTVNPYLGTDAAVPFLERGGVIALCRTSNPGAGELQDLDLEGQPLYLAVAEMVAQRWAQHGECGLVVGATAPEQLQRVRAVAPGLPILIPGVGAQGGDLVASVHAGRSERAPGACGVIVNSSRQILYASSGADFAMAARAEATALHTALVEALADPAGSLTR
jgi:orotidine-5'-phosphate decarboxylase